MKTIYKRELRSYFANNTAFVVIAALIFFIGIFFNIINMRGGNSIFGYTIDSASISLIFVIPILTMKSFAGEKKENTDKLLFSLPIRTKSIVLGKFLSLITVYAIGILIVCLFPVIIGFFGNINYIAAYSSILAYFLLGIALISICMFISSHTENEMISAVISIAVLFMIYLFKSFSVMIPKTALASYIAALVVTVALGFGIYKLLKDYLFSLSFTLIFIVAETVLYIFNKSIYEKLFPNIFTKLALFDRLADFTYGFINIGAYLIFISVTVIFVYLSYLSVENRRRG